MNFNRVIFPERLNNSNIFLINSLIFTSSMVKNMFDEKWLWLVKHKEKTIKSGKK
jgi:hypothetical protein